MAVVPLYYPHHHDSPPNPIWGTTSHGQILCQSREMIKHVVPSLLGIVLLKYQGNPGALFAGYPALAVWCFILSHCAYWALLSKVKPQMPDTKYLGVLIHAALGYGLISALSLLSVLLPHQIWFAPLLTWMLVALLLVWLVFYAAYIWCRSEPATFAFHGILANMFHLRGVANLTDATSRLPV